MAPERGDVEGWKSSPWSKLPTWAKWTIGVVGAFILLGIGSAIGSGEEDDLKAEVAQLTAERDKATAEVAAVVDRKDAILAQAAESATQIVGDARSERSRIGRELGQLQSEASSTQEELDETESSLAGAERKKALGSITDGIWQAETDFIPGTYRSPGGSGCYWALLNSADTSDILNNGGFNPNQTITIDSPWFETSNCGEWKLVE